jgi:prepilin-type N-terminal cleavage/methylation domain-containing protein
VTRPRQSRGFQLIELLAAVVLLGIALTLIATLMQATLVGRRHAADQRLALLELSNQMERWAARDWSELVIGPARAVPSTPEIERQLSHPRLELEISEYQGLKRLALTLRWRQGPKLDHAPARLVSYVANRGSDVGR